MALICSCNVSGYLKYFNEYSASFSRAMYCDAYASKVYPSKISFCTVTWAELTAQFLPKTKI